MKLANLMKIKGYSFQDLAEASGLGKATITRIVYGQAKTPHPGTQRKLAQVLGVSIQDIDEFKTSLGEAIEPEIRVRLRPADDAELRASIAESDLEDQEGIVITLEEIEDMVSRKIAEKIAAQKASA